jgi:patatin-like phospholipase/acyl hydrolase
LIGTGSGRGSKPFRVLSLDGGGMRGVYASTYLGELAEAFARKRGVTALDVGKGFDLIAGTSTGAIVACALAAGVPLSDVVSLYREHGRAIFPRKLPTRFGLSLMVQLVTRPAPLASCAKALREVLEATFRSETLAQVYARRGIALAIPAVEMNRHHSWVFKTPHHPNTNGRDNRYRLADVCLATTAAPIFRSLAPLDDPNGGPSYFVFADGGLWANNPVIVGLVDGQQLLVEDPQYSGFIETRGTEAGLRYRHQTFRGDMDLKSISRIDFGEYRGGEPFRLTVTLKNGQKIQVQSEGPKFLMVKGRTDEGTVVVKHPDPISSPVRLTTKRPNRTRDWTITYLDFQ